PDTPYDLASLTKVLATTPAMMKLVEGGALSLDQPLADFYPLPVNDPKREITLADLLSHQSGLPAWLPLYEEVDPEKMDPGTIRAAIIQRILNTSLEYAPRSRAVYSDLGFILLGDIVEQVTGVSLDTFCRDHFYQPLGLTSLRFNPPEEMRAAVPPTGTDALRQQPIQGVVNDTNGFVLGGVAGHAGLFGNARDVAAWGQLMIQRGIYECQRMFRHRTVERFCSRYNPRKHARALGWDTPTSGGSTGKYFSSRSIGHLGFTGTSLWVDLKREVVVVLLSNRVHPVAAQNRMNEIRPPLHDAIMEAIPKR
ncbi:MAG: class A beta-lactamase-related serine hydrolase, partial [Calditrichaeota bacterium]